MRSVEHGVGGDPITVPSARSTAPSDGGDTTSRGRPSADAMAKQLDVIQDLLVCSVFTAQFKQLVREYTSAQFEHKSKYAGVVTIIQLSVWTRERNV